MRRWRWNEESSGPRKAGQAQKKVEQFLVNSNLIYFSIKVVREGSTLDSIISFLIKMPGMMYYHMVSTTYVANHLKQMEKIAYD